MRYNVSVSGHGVSMVCVCVCVALCCSDFLPHIKAERIDSRKCCTNPEEDSVTVTGALPVGVLSVSLAFVRQVEAAAVWILIHPLYSTAETISCSCSWILTGSTGNQNKGVSGWVDVCLEFYHAVHSRTACTEHTVPSMHLMPFYDSYMQGGS